MTDLRTIKTAGFELRQLQHFLVVYRLGSYSEAAFELGLTQQAVSASIKKLESSLGAVLFIRGRAGAVPTMAGEQLLHHAQLVLRDAYAAYEQVSDLGIGRSGVVRLGVADDPFGTFSARVVARMQRERPFITPRIVHDLGGRLREQLVDGALDLIWASPAKAWRSDRYMTVERLDRSQMVILCGRGHPLAGIKVDIARTAEFPWIYSGEHVRSVMEDMFGEAGAPPPQTFCMVDGPAAFSLTLLTMNTHLAPGNSKFIASVHGGTLVTSLDIEVPNDTRHGCIAYRRNVVHNEALRYTIDAIRSVVQASESTPPGATDTSNL
jgi:DNA-binding transcriptional LysR family regulator